MATASGCRASSAIASRSRACCSTSNTAVSTGSSSMPLDAVRWNIWRARAVVALVQPSRSFAAHAAQLQNVLGQRGQCIEAAAVLLTAAPREVASDVRGRAGMGRYCSTRSASFASTRCGPKVRPARPTSAKRLRHITAPPFFLFSLLFFLIVVIRKSPELRRNPPKSSEIRRNFPFFLIIFP